MEPHELEQVVEIPKGTTYGMKFTVEGDNENVYRVVVGRSWGMFRCKLQRYDKNGMLIETEGDLEVGT